MPTRKFWDRRRKLKAAYQGLTGDQIRDLRMSGTDVTDEVRIPIVAYVGDSAPAGLDQCPAMYQARVLITELNCLSPPRTGRKKSTSSGTFISTI